MLDLIWYTHWLEQLWYLGQSYTCNAKYTHKGYNWPILFNTRLYKEMLDNIDRCLILSEMTIQKIEGKKAKIADWIVYNNTGQYWTILDNIWQYWTIWKNIGQYWVVIFNILMPLTISQFIAIANNFKTFLGWLWHVTWASHRTSFRSLKTKTSKLRLTPLPPTLFLTNLFLT